MPELPEVEVTRRSFAERIRGARVRAVRLGKPLRWALGAEPGSLVGRTVADVSRRGKYLWIAFEGDDAGGLLVHLGMSGSLAFHESPTLPSVAAADRDGPLGGPRGTAGLGSGPAPGVPGPDARLPGAHDHFDLLTDRGLLRLTDPRRFGAVVWSRAHDAAPAATLLAKLGVEPFDAAFDGAHLKRALARRRVAVKQALLAGDVVVGAGNIYASEALFEAGIDPRTRSDRLSRPRCDRLAAAIRATLARAVEVGGSTLRDFADAHGNPGAFQAEARVYGRAGLPCVRCGAAVRRVVQGGRATFFCPGCQKR